MISLKGIESMRKSVGAAGSTGGGAGGSGKRMSLTQSNSFTNRNYFARNSLVGLEQLIHSQHMDADGQEHLSLSGRKNRLRNLEFRPSEPSGSFGGAAAAANAGGGGGGGGGRLLSNATRAGGMSISPLDAVIERSKGFRTEQMNSWNANDSIDFKYVRK